MKTLMILALAVLMGTANAQPPMKDTPRMREGRGLKEMPDLDEATQAKIDKLRDEHQKSVIALRAKMKAARVDFRSMMDKDNPDESALLAKQKEIAGMRAELEASTMKHRFAVEKLLTPEQRKSLREHRGRGIGGGRGFIGRHGDGGHGRGAGPHHGRGLMKHHGGSCGEDSCCG